jgi:hypothetical protein
MAVAKMAGSSYEESIEKAIFAPLGMTRSSFTKPRDSEGIIPVIRNFWRHNLEVYQPYVLLMGIPNFCVHCELTNVL